MAGTSKDIILFEMKISIKVMYAKYIASETISNFSKLNIFGIMDTSSISIKVMYAK